MKKLMFCVMTVFSLVLFASSSAQAQLLAGYDMDSNTGVAAGDSVLDISGFGTAIDGVLQANASLVVDATRPGSSAGNLVLNTGSVGLGAFAPFDAKLNTGSNSVSMVLWVKTTQPGAFQNMFGRDGGGAGNRLFNQGGSVAIAISNGANNPGAFQAADPIGAINDGAWHHLAVIMDTTTLNITGYLDGAVDMVLDTTLPPFGNGGINALLDISNGLDIGGRSGDGADRFPNSLIDDAGYIRGALSANDVAGLFNGSKTLSDFAVPEPSSIILLGSLGFGMLLSRRRC